MKRKENPDATDERPKRDDMDHFDGEPPGWKLTALIVVCATRMVTRTAAAAAVAFVVYAKLHGLG